MKISLLIVFAALTFFGFTFFYVWVQELRKIIRLLLVKPVWQQITGKITGTYARQLTIQTRLPLYTLKITRTFVETSFEYNGQQRTGCFYAKEFNYREMNEATEYVTANFVPGVVIPLYINQKDTDEVVMDEAKEKRSKVSAMFFLLKAIVIAAMSIAMMGLDVVGIVTQIQKSL